jgi:mRNA interferase MazF
MTIKRGDIWLVNLEPVLGAEMRKTRPVVVISLDCIGKLPIRLVAPITDWKPHYQNHIWIVKIKPSNINSLSKESAIDTLQLRGVDASRRFYRKLGQVENDILNQIIIAIKSIIE